MRAVDADEEGRRGASGACDIQGLRLESYSSPWKSIPLISDFQFSVTLKRLAHGFFFFSRSLNWFTNKEVPLSVRILIEKANDEYEIEFRPISVKTFFLLD